MFRNHFIKKSIVIVSAISAVLLMQNAFAYATKAHVITSGNNYGQSYCIKNVGSALLILGAKTAESYSDTSWNVRLDTTFWNRASSSYPWSKIADYFFQVHGYSKTKTNSYSTINNTSDYRVVSNHWKIYVNTGIGTNFANTNVTCLFTD